jgi:hypothetical protein
MVSFDCLILSSVYNPLVVVVSPGVVVSSGVVVVDVVVVVVVVDVVVVVVVVDVVVPPAQFAQYETSLINSSGTLQHVVVAGSHGLGAPLGTSFLVPP